MYTKLMHFSRKTMTGLLQRVTIVALLFWGAVGLFVAVADEVLEQEPIGLDQWALLMAQDLHRPWLDSLVLAVTQLGSAAVIAPVIVGLVAWLAYSQRISAAFFVAISAGGAGVMNYFLKLAFQRDRPSLWQALVVENSFSFPSGHAMGSSALVFSIIALLWSSRWRWLAVALGLGCVVAVGASRVYLGVHYPSDIVAGWCVSLAWVLLMRQLILAH